MLGYQFRSAVESTLHKISASKKIRIRSITWGAIPTACINQNFDVILADVADDAVFTRPYFERYIGFVVHELLHAKYTDFSVRGSNQYLGQLLNAVEDVRIERKAIQNKLVGNIESLMTNLVNGMVAESLTAVSDWSNPMQYPFILAVYARRYANKVPMPKELISIFENASTQIDTCNNTADALVVAQWVYDQLQAIGDEPDQDQDQGDDQSGDQSGDQGDDQGDEQSGDGDGQSEGDGEDGAQDGSGRPTSDQNANGDTSPPTTDKSAQKPNGKAREVEPTCEVPTGKQGIGAYNKKDLMVKPDYFMDQCCDHDLSANVSARLQYDVRKLFENTGHESFERNKRSGVLNRSSIASIAQGKTNVFKRHLAVGGIDSAVVIGLDLSWSMLDYNRFPNALKTANALMHVLTKAGVAVAIIGFSDNVSVLKPFEMNSFNGENVLRKTKLDNSTNDYLAIRYGHELLQGRGETRKVLFMLTDGEGAMSESQLQIESGNRVGITTVGIGIGVDISDTYKTNLLVKNADDLGNASFSKIKLVA